VKLRVYLDTSVFSALVDEAVPVRQRETQDFFDKLDAFDPSTSTLGRDELAQTVDHDLRERLMTLVARVDVIEMTEEMSELAEHYLRSGVFGPAMRNDALHVAAAVLTRQDVLLSWNFRHLVNRRRRALVNEVNTLLGLPPIEIVAPPEL